MNQGKKLFEFLLNEYSRNTLIFSYSTWIALFGHTFYGVLWTFFYSQPHEDLKLRIICASLFLPYLFVKYFTDRNWLKLFLSVYWYFCIIINLPFIFTYLTMMNNFSGLWLICETMMILLIIILMPNLLTFVIVFGFGILLAYILYLFNSNHPVDFHERIYLEYLLLMPMVIGGSILINFSSKTGEINLKVEEEKSRIFKSLAASIAHELRNPLNTINMLGLQIRNLMNDINAIKNKKSPTNQSQSYIKIDKNYIDDLDEANEINSSIKLKLIEYTENIKDAIKNANTIINAILSDMSENEKQKRDFIFSYMQPKEIIDKIIKTYGYKNETEKSKILTIMPRNSEENFILKIFPDRLNYVIFNIIKNALYYMQEFPDSNIIIGTEKNRPFNDKIYNTIFVYDNGPGIPEEILPKLFNDFFTFGKKDGTGLGLPFCKRNMFLFGGDIICESKFGGCDENGKKLNGWTKFSLLFPVINEFPDEVKKVFNIDEENDLNKILILNDNEEEAESLKNKIKEAMPNVICESFSDIREILKIPNPYQYKLILMDIDISKDVSIKFAKKIRLNSKKARISIIALTSLSKKSFLQINKEFNDLESKDPLFCDYISKSAKNTFLFRSINKWLFNIEDELNYMGSRENYTDILRDKKALLADDQKINLIITKKILESVGLSVTEVSNGKELVESYRRSLDENGKSNFDIILTDINMPPYDGDEAVKEIRLIEDQYSFKYNLLSDEKIEKNLNNSESNIYKQDPPQIPVIAITGNSGEENFIHFFDCKINDYFIKGGNTEILIRMIANYV